MIDSPVTEQPKPRSKRYPAQLQAEIVKRLAKGDTQSALGREFGIPQQTVGQWALDAGLGKQRKHSIVARVQHSIDKQVAQITNQATKQVQALIDKSLEFGNDVLNQAQAFVPSSGPDGLLGLVNAGEKAINIQRKALGMDLEQAKSSIHVGSMSIYSRDPGSVLDQLVCGVNQPQNPIIDVPSTLQDESAQ